MPLFYIIGIAINIIVFTLVIIWAIKEWRKTNYTKDKQDK